MNRVSLAFVRVLFFVMLFVSTACNKMDRSLQENAALGARDGLAVEKAQAVEAERVEVLQARVAYLEAQLKDVRALSARGDGSVAQYWD